VFVNTTYFNIKILFSKKGGKLYNMKYNTKKMGKRIKEERNALGLTQSKFAEKLGKSEESRQIIANWEKGKTIPAFDDMLKMCELFDCELGYLLCEFDNKTREATDVCKALGISKEAEAKLKEIKISDYRETLITLSQMIESDYFFKLLKTIHLYRFNFNKHQLVFYNYEEEEIVSKALGCDKYTDVREHIKASSRYLIEETFMKILDDLK